MSKNLPLASVIPPYADFDELSADSISLFRRASRETYSENLLRQERASWTRWAAKGLRVKLRPAIEFELVECGEREWRGYERRNNLYGIRGLSSLPLTRDRRIKGELSYPAPEGLDSGGVETRGINIGV